jgi:hypothetical protein
MDPLQRSKWILIICEHELKGLSPEGKEVLRVAIESQLKEAELEAVRPLQALREKEQSRDHKLQKAFGKFLLPKVRKQ